MWSKDRAKRIDQGQRELAAESSAKFVDEFLWSGRWNMYDSFGLWVFDPFRSFWCFMPFGWLVLAVWVWLWIRHLDDRNAAMDLLPPPPERILARRYAPERAGRPGSSPVARAVAAVRDPPRVELRRHTEDRDKRTRRRGVVPRRIDLRGMLIQVRRFRRLQAVPSLPRPNKYAVRQKHSASPIRQLREESQGQLRFSLIGRRVQSPSPFLRFQRRICEIIDVGSGTSVIDFGR
jgi:hypothetical protein